MVKVMKRKTKKMEEMYSSCQGKPAHIMLYTFWVREGWGQSFIKGSIIHCWWLQLYGLFGEEPCTVKGFRMGRVVLPSKGGDNFANTRNRVQPDRNLLSLLLNWLALCVCVVVKCFYYTPCLRGDLPVKFWSQNVPEQVFVFFQVWVPKHAYFHLSQYFYDICLIFMQMKTFFEP